MQAADFGKVAVIYGGDSEERAVSLQSGEAVYRALLSRGVDAHLIDSRARDQVLSLRDLGFSRAFIMLHGRGGEDGEMQALLQWQGLPYTGSGVMACAVAMDKVICKRIWQSYGLPVLEDVVLFEGMHYEEVRAALRGDFVIKPALEGSSVGVSLVRNVNDWKKALIEAKLGQQKVMAERCVVGRELTCAVLGNTVLPVVEIVASKAHVFYDYQAKYIDDSTRYICPAPLDEKLTYKVKELTLKAFQVIDAKGWGRADFMLDEKGELWLLEINLAPGMTSHSLLPQAAAVHGWDFAECVWRVLAETL